MSKSNGKLSKSEAGRLGGLATAQRHGSDHMSKIGRKGAETLHERYKMVPVNNFDFAYVDRLTDEVIALQYGNLNDFKRHR